MYLLDLVPPLYRVKQIIDITNSSLVLTDNKVSLNNIDCFNLEWLKKYKNCDIKENKNDIVYMIFTSGSTGIPKGVPIFVLQFYS